MRCRLTWEKDRPGHACLRDGEPFVYRGAIICLLAKVASTRLKLLLLKSARVPRFPDVTPGDADRFDTDPHGETLPDSVSGVGDEEWRTLVGSTSAPRYIVVRNPFTRLLSGYLDKVERSPQPTKWPSGFNGSGGFAAFVRAVVAEPPPTLNKHFAPQSGQCGLTAGIRYTALRLEEATPQGSFCKRPRAGPSRRPSRRPRAA